MILSRTEIDRRVADGDGSLRVIELPVPGVAGRMEVQFVSVRLFLYCKV